MTQSSFYVHPTAEVSPKAHIGAGTIGARLVFESFHIGETVILARVSYINTHVHIGLCVKIQNHVSVFEGVTLRMVFHRATCLF